MDFEKAFPLKFWINLGSREDRRVEMAARLEEIGIAAERFAAVDARGIENRRQGARRPLHGLERDAPATMCAAALKEAQNAGRHALALTQRLALREAARRKAPAVLLLEDDVVFHPNFRILIGAVELPDDWGIFYLGCSHLEKPEWTGARVVRVCHAVDTHAVAIRAPYYRRVLELLDRHGKPELGKAQVPGSFLTLLHQEIPTYACYPNLAWQGVSGTNLAGTENSNYTTDGRQKNWPTAVDGLLGELVNGKNPEARAQRQEEHRTSNAQHRTSNEGMPNGGRMPQPRLGLLFLTRGDVNHPEVWREFIAEAPDRVSVFSHPKFPVQIHGGFLEGTAVSDYYDTEWGCISLVRATRALLLAALEDESLTHFALMSENCVPVKPLGEILRLLELDGRSQFGFRTLKESVGHHQSRIEAVPQVPLGCWRFQSQWWLMNRATAVFSAGQDFTGIFEKMFASDEAYFATVLAMQGVPLEGEVNKKDSTWTWWEKDAGSPTSWPVLPKEKLQAILQSGALFARKFPKGADIGKYGLHRSAKPEITLPES